jgi:hypothetical protein
MSAPDFASIRFVTNAHLSALAVGESFTTGATGVGPVYAILQYFMSTEAGSAFQFRVEKPRTNVVKVTRVR